MTILSTPRSAVRLAAKGRPLREHLFKIALVASLVIALGFLVIVLYSMVSKGIGRFDARLWENMPSIRRPENAFSASAR